MVIHPYLEPTYIVNLLLLNNIEMPVSPVWGEWIHGEYKFTKCFLLQFISFR